jgi:hypothetical protein
MAVTDWLGVTSRNVLIVLVIVPVLGLLAVPVHRPVARADTEPTGLPATGAWFGAAPGIQDWQGLDGEAILNAMQAQIGRTLAMIREFYSWDEEFPTDIDYWLKDQGQIPLISWNAGKLDRTWAMWADIAAGLYDADIDARAAAIKAYVAPVYLIFHHEPEPKQSQPDPPGEPADFVAAWQHIHDRFERDGVTNVTWVLTLLNSTYGTGKADQYYPGDDYVDVLGADGYNWYACPNRPDADWREFSDMFDGFYDYGLVKGKPMFVPEMATGEDPLLPGRKAKWFTNAAATLLGWPQIKAVNYYNVATDDGCQWWVDTSDSSLAGYHAFGVNPYLNPPPPLTYITSGPADLTSSTSATFVFTSNILGSTFTCALDGGVARSCVTPYTVTGLLEGAHSIVITATDPVSRQRGPATWAWTVDTTAPVASITAEPDLYSDTSSAAFKFSSDQDGSTFICKLDTDPAVACTTPETYSDLPDGEHDFGVVATDPAGNVSAAATYSWTVDTTAPVATITSGPDPLVNSKSATFTFESNEPGSIFACAKDSGLPAVCTSPKTFDWLSDGTHTVTVTVKDLAGNLSTPAAWTWTIDTANPVVTITSGPADPTPDTRAKFTFTADDEHGVTFTCTLDSGLPATCVSGVIYTGLSTGDHLFGVYATDDAGNVGNTATYSWTII